MQKSGTNSLNGLSITSYTLIMSAGSYRSRACTTSTNKMGPLRPSKASSKVRLLHSSGVAACYPITLFYKRLDVFRPLFEVTRDPSSHPELHVFLQRVIGFDTVDDESKTERRFHRKFPYPRLWNAKESPPYSYW